MAGSGGSMVGDAQIPATKPLTGWQRELLDAIEQELKAAGSRPCMVTVRFDGARAWQVFVARPVKRVQQAE